MSLLVLLYVYIFGGVTFLPLCLVASYYFLQWYLPKTDEVKGLIKKEESGTGSVEEDDEIGFFSDEKAKKEYENIRVTEIEEKASSGVNVFKSGWLTVTTEYYVFPQNSATEKNNEPESNKSAYTTLYKLVRKKSTRGTNGEPIDNDNEAEDAQNEESNEKSSSSGNQKRRKNKYYAVLRHGNLFLYKDEDQADVLHVIVLSNHVVSLWPRNLPDGQLFSKMSAICVLRKDISKLQHTGDSRLPPAPPPKDSAVSIEYNAQNKSVTTLDILENGELPPKHAAFYIYADSNYEKEDWYFDLIKATKRTNVIRTGTEKDLLEPSIFAKTFHPKTADVISLIQNLHSSEGQLHTRWFNAIIGRVFLALYGTEGFENYIKNKLLNKLQKINKPGFLEEFKIEKVLIGKSAPLLTSPKLTQLTPEGDLQVDASIFYNGGISFQVSTKVNINLGTRFKPRDISILLAVTVKKLQGDVVFKVKRPPTERIWWGFKTMPYIDLAVEPVVSARQITTGMITRTIENKLKESVKESLVLPAMDDITFFSTKGDVFRGGIWDKSGVPEMARATKGDNLPIVEPESLLDSSPKKMSEERLSSPTKSGEDISSRLRSESFAGSVKSNVLTDDENDEDKLISNDTSSQFFSDLKSSSASIFSFKKDKDKIATHPLSTSIKKSLSKTVTPTPKLNKSNSTVKISNDQFLSDGSFIANETDAEKIFLKNNENMLKDVENQDDLENATDSDKKFMTKPFKKIGQWYFKEKDDESPLIDVSGEPTLLASNLQGSPKSGYKPPEMILSRRQPRSKNRDRSSSEVLQEYHHEAISNDSLKLLIESGQGTEEGQQLQQPKAIQQPYGKIPEMTFPSTRSPSQFISSNGLTPAPALPPRTNSTAKRRPPPKSADNSEEPATLL